MNTNRVTKPAETAHLNEGIEAISDKALDQVVGGLNPQPLPPARSELTSFKNPGGCPGWL